jgi:uncharacterized protein YeaO (DUF488 family)
MIRADKNITPEQIQANWAEFLEVISTHISSPRKEQLLDFYQSYEERFVLMPAAHKREYHNAFPGGYIAHVLNVVDAALKIDQVWRDMGVKDTYTTEELVFSALNHDLGKWGDFNHDAVIPQTDEWRRTKLGEMYMFNSQLSYMSVPDRSLWILSSLGIQMTPNEYISIKIHDGLYDPANEPYLKSWSPETKPRTSLVYIIHQADLLAARVEFEHEYLDELAQPKKQEVKKTTTQSTFKKPSAQEKAYKNLGNKSNGLADLLKNL